jgi:Mn2+/Fe2+ NRAMP family transporter
VLLTRRVDVMGALVNSRVTTYAATAVAAVISGLNVTLIVLTFAGSAGGG